MPLKILHSSDNHGKYKRIIRDHADTEFDLWLDTGDFMPNAGRRKGGGVILAEIERPYQSRMLAWKQLARRLAEWLDGRPAVTVPGNHDFLSIGGQLRRFGYPEVYEINPAGTVECLGLTWSGFRHIYEMGSQEWMGEIPPEDFEPLVEAALAANPDILVTHSPPSDILSGGDPEYGVPCLPQALQGHQGKLKAHFFGHAHEDGGKTVEQFGIKFFNGACHVKLHELDL